MKRSKVIQKESRELTDTTEKLTLTTHKLLLGALSKPGYRKEIIFSKYFYLWPFLECPVSTAGDFFLTEVCLPF